MLFDRMEKGMTRNGKRPGCQEARNYSFGLRRNECTANFLYRLIYSLTKFEERMKLKLDEINYCLLLPQQVEWDGLKLKPAS